MSDVYCSTCREPYDDYHMRWDEVHELGLTKYDLVYWKKNQENPQILDEQTPSTDSTYRQYFEAIGWRFGRSVFNIKRCPSCPKEATINETRDAAVSELEDMLDGDQDGLVSMIEDMEYFGVFNRED